VKQLDLRIADSDSGIGRPTGSSHNGLDLNILFAAMHRQRFFVGLWALLGVLLGISYVAVTPPSYYADSTIMLSGTNNRGGVEPITALGSGMAVETAMESAIEVLRSQRIALAVTDSLDLTNDPRFLNPPRSPINETIWSVRGQITGFVRPFLHHGEGAETGLASVPMTEEERALEERLWAAGSLQRDLDVRRLGRSTVFSIGFASYDPMLAADISNAYAEAYVNDLLNANLEATERTVAWLSARLDQLSQEARAAALEAERYRAQTDSLLTRGNMLTEEAMVAQAELRALEQRAVSLANLYETFLAQSQQLETQRDVPVSSVRLLSAAQAPTAPFAPRTTIVIAGMTLLLASIGSAVAVRREYREVFVRSGEQIRRDLGQRFLGYLPMTRRMRESYVERKTGDGGEPQLSPSLFALSNPQSHFTQTLRNVRLMADARAPGKRPQILGVMSLRPGEGKTTVAANLAGLIAATGAATLLIDGDHLNPSLSRRMRVLQGGGFLKPKRQRAEEPLQDGQLLILREPHLHVLSCANSDDPAEQASALDALQSLLREANSAYAQIVLDLPPIGLLADARVMLPLVDAVVLVAEWGKTPKSLIEEALETEPTLTRKLLGIVINKTNMKRLRAYTSANSMEAYYLSALR
jgi:uncharacterized protein involved in exopolysaccharide biosynthesis/Mrp family chromosome partitioning ATPase